MNSRHVKDLQTSDIVRKRLAKGMRPGRGTGGHRVDAVHVGEGDFVSSVEGVSGSRGDGDRGAALVRAVHGV